MNTPFLPFTVRAACFLLLILFVSPGARAESPAFAEGSRLYDQQDYAGARDRFAQIISDGSWTPNVFYNLGNADYRLGKTGRSILDYQRALLLEPRHPEARINLALVRRQSGARLLPEIPLSFLVLPLSTPTYCVIGASAFWVVAFSFAGFFLWRRLRGPFILTGLLALFLAVYSGAALALEIQRRAIAVVIVPEAVARLEAADRAGIAETLPAGSDVRVLSERGEWIYCALPGGGRGWLPRKSIERIVPGEASA